LNSDKQNQEPVKGHRRPWFGYFLHVLPSSQEDITPAVLNQMIMNRGRSESVMIYYCLFCIIPRLIQLELVKIRVDWLWKACIINLWTSFARVLLRGVTEPSADRTVWTSGRFRQTPAGVTALLSGNGRVGFELTASSWGRTCYSNAPNLSDPADRPTTCFQQYARR
jgi:hypothetical protein